MTTSTTEFADLGPLEPGQGAEGLVLVRLGQLRLLHDRADGAVRAVHDRDRRQGGRLRRRRPRRQLLRKTVSLLGLDLAAGSLPFYLTSFATILSAFLLPIVGAMVDRSPRKKVHMAGFAWAGAFFCGAAVLHEGRELAARRRLHRDGQRAGRLLADQLLGDPLRHLHRGGARPGLLARLGVRLPRRRPAAPGQPGHGARPRRDRAQHRAGRADLAALGGAVVGRRSRSSRSCGCATARRCNVVVKEGGLIARSFGRAVGPRSGTCAATR